MSEPERQEFCCPDCGAARWHAELFIPGNLRVSCIACGWASSVREIERQMREGEL
jgi:hypothetical protein